MADVGRWLRTLLGAHRAPDPAPPLSQEPSRRSASAPFAEGNNECAVSLYAQLRQQPGNLFFSPFSIRTALAMTHAGARGETAAQLAEALCIWSPGESLHVATAAIIQRLNAASDAYTMRVANSLWCQHETPIVPEYLALIARHYGGELHFADFHHAADAARETMNRWVAEQTRETIRELIPPGCLDADSRVVLVNAAYFKGSWERPFPKDATRAAPFFLAGGGKVQAPLMYQQGQISYARAAGLQAVDLDYMGGDLSMLVIVPDRRDGLQELEAALSTSMLRDCLTRMQTREVQLFLPRFRITSGSLDVRAPLTTLGARLAFTPLQADFSGINGYEPPAEESLFISGVLHQAFVEVNEEGTEAAAATATDFHVTAALRPSKPVVPIVRADHPFLFAIRDRKSSAILFMGRVADPSGER